MMDIDSDFAHIAQLRATKARRLKIQEQRQANDGINTPPEILIEIATLREDISRLDYAIATPISSDVARALGESGQYQAISRELKYLREWLADRIDFERELRVEWQEQQTQRVKDEIKRFERWMLLLSIGLGFTDLVLVFLVTMSFLGFYQ